MKYTIVQKKDIKRFLRHGMMTSHSPTIQVTCLLGHLNRGHFSPECYNCGIWPSHACWMESTMPHSLWLRVTYYVDEPKLWFSDKTLMACLVIDHGFAQM